VQAKLLRALEQGSFFRVGGTQKVEVNVRIIAASNRDLPKLVEDGRLRAELYYRINTISLELPPLRERIVDVPVLADFFLRQFGVPVPPRCTEAALDALMAYHWPGNVRELRNVIERAVLLATDGVIDSSDLPLQRQASYSGTVADREPPMSLAELERRHIELVLAHANWHQGQAANMLGISSKTLYRKIREYGFNRPRSSEVAGHA
jgi:DNA-binding NtrC family response regulator